jgi:hypothetical protein
MVAACASVTDNPACSAMWRNVFREEGEGGVEEWLVVSGFIAMRFNCVGRSSSLMVGFLSLSRFFLRKFLISSGACTFAAGSHVS